MNHFKEYIEHVKKQSEILKIVNHFDYILDNIWCVISEDKGIKRWKEIKGSIPEPYRFKIDIEINHVWLKHGLSMARLAVKDEMSEYIKYLIQRIHLCS